MKTRLALLAVSTLLSAASAQSYKAPRTRDGHPNLQGIWQAANAAYGSLEAHTAAYGFRAGGSVIVDPADGKIPYKAEAIAKRDENFKTRLKTDPVGKCYSPGVPRLMYLPHPFQIFQTGPYVFIASEFAHTSRMIYVNGTPHLPDAEFWMGDSRGRWEGETLVVDVADFNAETWLDMSGNYHSEQLHVIERYTRTAADTLMYEATLEDPKVYSRPWTIRMPLYLSRDANPVLLEYECHVYLDDEGLKK